MICGEIIFVSLCFDNFFHECLDYFKYQNQCFQTIRDLHANSVNVKMITGDSKNIALSIGQNLNIHQSCDTALSGKTLQINPLPFLL